MTSLIPDEAAPNQPARRTGVIAALAAVPVLIVGAVLVMGVGGDADSLSTNNETTDTVATTTTNVAPTTTSPVFVQSAASTTPPTTAVAITIPPTTAPPTTTSTTLAPTTTPAPATTVPATLPEQPAQPIAPPPDPRGYEDQIRLGSISIPKLGVSEPLFSGIRLTTLDNGPGHWPGTALPGQVGNVVVAAHRTSHGAAFRNIDQLVAGDIVQFDTGSGAIGYTVTGTQIVGPDAMWIVDPTDTPTATLFACHPPGSTRQRIVVNLELS
jgi:sortase A